MAGQNTVNAPWRFAADHSLIAVSGLYQLETLAGAATLSSAYPAIVRFDPDGAHRDVTLDAEETNTGLYRRIINGADAAENLVVKNDAGSTIATLNQSEQGEFYCTGSAWQLICITTIALS